MKRWLCCLAMIAGCAKAPEDAAPVPESAQAPAEAHTVVVFATASLKRPFEALAKRYEQDHPGAVVELRCEGGAQLLEAMHAGAACDVLAIGDSSLMARFMSAGYGADGSLAELARSRVAIAVAAGNPKQIAGVADLGRADVRVALGARSSSIGRHGRWVLSAAKVTVWPVVEANTAVAVLAKVAAGEADAAIVYATSFADAGDGVQRIDVPESQNTPVLYTITATRQARDARGAAAFRALALGPAGQQVLREAGFLPVGAKIR